MQIPALVKEKRRESLALRWILEATRQEMTKNHKPFSFILAKQIYFASKKEGNAFLKKINTHKIAETNRAFAHSKWW